MARRIRIVEIPILMQMLFEIDKSLTLPLKNYPLQAKKYSEYIDDAKREEKKITRLEKKSMALEDAGLNDKYKSY